MRDPSRIPRLQAKLIQAWQLCPQMRLGQFLYNLVGSADELFMLEDDQLEQLLDDFIENPPYEKQELMGEAVYVPKGKNIHTEMTRTAKGLLAKLEAEREPIDPLDPRKDDPDEA